MELVLPYTSRLKTSVYFRSTLIRRCLFVKIPKTRLRTVNMAALGSSSFSLLLIFFGFLLINQNYVSGKIPLEATVEEWVKELKKKLESKFSTSMPTGTIQTTYQKIIEELISKSDIEIESLKGASMVREMANEMVKMLEKKTAALKNAVTRAENASRDHHYVDNISPQSVFYYKSKEPEHNNLSSILQYESRFKQPVNTSVSSVHIPVEIYENDPEILNGLAWTQQLDDVFRENYEADNDILWQYFGSQTGFMRSFPASVWKLKEGKVDLYDVRRRPWYTQGSSSPKDMLILVDTSGSVHGQSLQLIKVAVKSILDTLGENDFVLIVRFSKDAGYISDCYKKFIQADYRNKQKLSQAVDLLEAKDMADITKGLEFAFDQFEKFENDTESGANCNKMIMLLTDGGMDNGETVFKKRNFGRPPKDRIRVFTYAVGQNPNPIKDLKWMACANRGRFSEIPAMGAIRARVQEHLPYLVTGKAKINEILWQMTIDPRRPTGLGMMTTVTLPVYNRSSEGSNQTILGVMGIDVTTQQMQRYSPVWKLGPNGYTFAINTNGYVIFHPNLRINSEMQDPPNLDFLDVEVENEKKVELRRKMIDGLEDSMKLETFVVSSDENHVNKKSREYFHVPLGNTTFSLGLTLPDYQANIIKWKKKFTEDLANETIDLLNKTEMARLLAPWDYFINMSTLNQSSSTEDLILALKSYSDNQDKLNTDEIKQLYIDLRMAAEGPDQFIKDMIAYKQISNSNNETVNQTDFNDEHNNTVAVFFGTYGGLTCVFPSHKKSLFNEVQNTWKANYFKRTLETDDYVYSVPYILNPRGENDTTPPVTVTQAVKVKNGDMKLAVSGVMITHESLVNIMETATSKDGSRICQDSSVYCYLVDDGAFLIATNQIEEEKQIGRFFGHVDAGLMDRLMDKAYSRVVEYDYQATCTVDPNKSSSATSFRNKIPSLTLLFELLTVNWWSSFWTWTVVNMNVFSWLTPPPAVEASSLTEPQTYSCVKKRAQYYFKEDFTGGIKDYIYPCNNCTRDFVAQRLDGSNLLFVIVSSPCPNCYVSAKEKDLTQEPIETDDSVCNNTARYRKNPEECFDFDINEDNSKCSGPMTNQLSVLLVVVGTLVTLLLTTMR